MDYFSFYTGNCFDAYRYLGAHQTEEGIVFRTYAPSAGKVALIGEFSDWEEIDMEPIHNGQFYEAVVPEATVGMMYKYRIYHADGTPVDHADPYGFGMQLRPESASIVRDIETYQFGDSDWMHSQLDTEHQPMNIYELHLGSWHKLGEGKEDWYSYDELAVPLIAHLKQGGYNYVEFMPLTEYPADESWGYQTTGYFSPTARYGTGEQLMALVDALHQAEIGVLLDFVPIHFALDSYGLGRYDGTPLYEYPDDDVGVSEWGSYNFLHSRGEVQTFLQSAADYWLRIFHFDGLRMDAISRIIYWMGDETRGVNDTALDFLKRLNSGLKSRFNHCLLIAEDSTSYGDVTAPVSQGGLGFDYKWDMGWMNDTLDYFKKTPAQRIDNYHKITFSMAYFYNEKYLLPFSHDEVVHGKATIVNKMYGDMDMKFPQARALYLYMYTHPGKKLDFMGNEVAQIREWDENREQDWFITKYPTHDAFWRFRQELHALYLTQPALSAEDYDTDGFKWVDCEQDGTCTYAFLRSTDDDQLLVIFNFGDTVQTNYTIELPGVSAAKLLMHTEWEEYNGTLPKGKEGLTRRKQMSEKANHGLTLSMDLPAFCGCVFALK